MPIVKVRGPQPRRPRPVDEHNRIPVDAKMLERLASLMVTIEEAAGVLGIGKNTLGRRLREEEYREAWLRGRSVGKLRIRNRQMEVAMAGSGPMLRWLGKQYLGQSDRVTHLVGDELPDTNEDLPVEMLWTEEMEDEYQTLEAELGDDGVHRV